MFEERKIITIGCTSKLLKRSGLSPETSLSDPTSALGNWHANIIFISRLQILLFVSDNSRLAVVTPAREVKSLASHLTRQLSALLEQLGVPTRAIDAELREMADAHISTTNSKSVLSTMIDYKLQMEAMILESGYVSPLEMSVNLSDVLVGPLNYRCPGEVALDLLRKYSPAG
jgi:hypothetical protein